MSCEKLGCIGIDTEISESVFGMHQAIHGTAYHKIHHGYQGMSWSFLSNH